jgi:excisionase family DNA binding protein
MIKEYLMKLRQDGQGYKAKYPKKISNGLPLFGNCIDGQRENYSLSNSEDDEWFTSEEAAGYLKISVKSLMNLTSQGKIRYYKLGSRNRYYKSELKSLLLGNPRGGF